MSREFRYWPEWTHWGFDEREAKTKFEAGQRKWARKTKSGYESMENYYFRNPQHRNKWPSPMKRKQYEAACRILVLDVITKSL